MRLWRRSEPVLPEATNAVPPTYSTVDDFVGHALRFPGNGWYEPLFGTGMAERVGTVDRCLQLTAQQIAVMPLRYKHGETAAPFQPWWVTDPDPAWYPNGIREAIFAAVWSIYAHGETFLYVTSRYADGFPRTWTVLDAVTMKVSDEGGTRGYRSNGVDVDPADVIQVMRNPNGGLRGTSVLEAYWSNVVSAYSAEMYAADVYQSTGVSRVALKSQRRLTAEQAADIQAQWVAAVSRRLGAPAIVPPDLDLMDAISISPKDLMLLESRDWDARQIAAAFGVPAMLLNIPITGGLTYQNPQQLFGLWWRSELMPRAGLVQDALSRWLPRGHWVEFDPSATLEPDLAAKVEIADKSIANGTLSVDEARAWVWDLPPLARGDQSAEFFEEAGTHSSLGAGPAAEEVLVP